ncbi:type II secretion system F family protein [Caminibacter pacificus]|uniref:General secretion pathway protein F/MSHA biogenesis protein MshG n=1 Tax=Caminibacter pacificus TaxID=1424653 RepID=A0AAJ4RC51_9BACT|nr:type II secretion system F family protein [Caminibacter pacificus]QCI27956.1 type II secretion system F family protein [Caminibacter pacificus]ROR39865.1 general secretion pathway protein F/MSHA biogenesis protein MshG [Caminibacter pacificus]
MKYYKITFFYKGKQAETIIKALNKSEAIIDAKKLKKGLLVKVEEVPMPFEERLKVFKDIVKTKVLRKKLNYPSYISSIRQLAVLIKAGISLKDALEDIGNNTKDPLVKELFLYAADAIDSGKSLTDAFAEYEEYVGGISLAMVRLGEQTGDLVMALESLADIYENMYENRRKMVKALRYPIITLVAIAVAFVFLILLVVPKFKAMFEQLHAQLPLPTRILLGIEKILTEYGLYVLIGFIVTVVLIIFFYKTSISFKRKVDALLLKTYLINKIIEYASLHRFLLTLASLLRSGIPLLDALKISEGIISNEVIKDKIKHIIKGINQGRSFTEMLKEVDLVNFVALRMISAGEESGELDVMLQNAAKYYEDRFQDIIDNMQASIEPIMLTIIGGLVLLIALGIFLPMWDLANAARNIG